MDNVTILLSTYNGEKYLEDQLNSLFSQENVNIAIFCRDDGSSDNTINIINEYIESHNIIKGNNIGVVNSFFHLINLVNNKSDYYAFADQDDCWNSNKLINAIDMIQAESSCCIPTMYCSRVEYVDEHLNHLGYSSIPTNISFENALVENIAIGCTMVFNRAAKELICRAIPTRGLMHDWWIYLLMSSIGKVIYDEWPSMQYRQHNENVVGGTNNYLLKNIRKISQFIKNIYSNKTRTTQQAAEFKTIYGHYLSNEQNAIIDEYIQAKVSFKRRLRLAMTGKFNRQNRIDNIFYKIQILLGEY